MITHFTAREFTRRIRSAPDDAKGGPVFVTERGRPAHVLLTYEDYRRLARDRMSLAEALAGPPEFDFDFEPPRLRSDKPTPPLFDDWFPSPLAGEGS